MGNHQKSAPIINGAVYHGLCITFQKDLIEHDLATKLKFQVNYATLNQYEIGIYDLSANLFKSYKAT